VSTCDRVIGPAQILGQILLHFPAASCDYGHRSWAVEECGSVSEVGHLPHQGLAGGLDTEGLRLTFKLYLKAESHSFQGAFPIAKPLQAIGVERQKLFRAKQPPLDDVNQLVEMERF
jgi:hypothetical protein